MDEKIAKELAALVRQFVSEQLKELREEITAVRLSPFPLSMENLQTLKQLAENPPKDGEDGEDGTSVTLEQVSTIIIETLPGIVASIKDDVLDSVNESVNEAVGKINIPTPADGTDGRDALDIEILPVIDESKSYPRGTYAMHDGGLWRTHAKSEGMRGWECLIDGLKSINVEYDGERGFTVQLSQSSGGMTEKSFAVPMIIDRGPWRNDGEYKQFDVTTYNGCMWIAQKDNADTVPGTSDAWRLSVRKGRDSRAPVKMESAK